MTITNEKLIEISETIRDHLIKQNRVSNAEGGCLYRAPCGAMCAVGFLIKDEFYNPVMEHSPAASPFVREAVCKSLDMKWTNGLSDVVKQWQFYHDTYFGPFLNGEYQTSPEQQHQNTLTWLKHEHEFYDA